MENPPLFICDLISMFARRMGTGVILTISGRSTCFCCLALLGEGESGDGVGRGGETAAG